jgi:hypothetical protein
MGRYFDESYGQHDSRAATREHTLYPSRLRGALRALPCALIVGVVFGVFGSGCRSQLLDHPDQGLGEPNGAPDMATVDIGGAPVTFDMALGPDLMTSSPDLMTPRSLLR